MGFVVLAAALSALGVTAGYYLPDLVDLAFERYEKIRGENSDFDELIRLAKKYPDKYMVAYIQRQLANYPDRNNPAWKGPSGDLAFQPYPPSDSTFVP